MVCLYLGIGFIFGLIPSIFFYMGWKSHKNVETMGAVAPKVQNMFRRKHKPIYRTAEQEWEREQEERIGLEEGLEGELDDESYI